MKKSSKKDALKKTRSGYKRIIRENMEKRYDAVEMFCVIINPYEAQNLWPEILLVSKIGLVIISEKEK